MPYSMNVKGQETQTRLAKKLSIPTTLSFFSFLTSTQVSASTILQASHQPLICCIKVCTKVVFYILRSLPRTQPWTVVMPMTLIMTTVIPYSLSFFSAYSSLPSFFSPIPFPFPHLLLFEKLYILINLKLMKFCLACSNFIFQKSVQKSGTLLRVS